VQGLVAAEFLDREGFGGELGLALVRERADFALYLDDLPV